MYFSMILVYFTHPSGLSIWRIKISTSMHDIIAIHSKKKVYAVIDFK